MTYIYRAFPLLFPSYFGVFEQSALCLRPPRPISGASSSPSPSSSTSSLPPCAVHDDATILQRRGRRRPLEDGDDDDGYPPPPLPLPTHVNVSLERGWKQRERERLPERRMEEENNLLPPVSSPLEVSRDGRPSSSSTSSSL